MKLNSKQMVVLLAVGLLFVISTPQEMAIAILDTTFIIHNQQNQPIGGARLDLYQHYFGSVPGNPTFTVYTDVLGVARRTVAQGIYTVKVTAVGYDVLTQELDMRSDRETGDRRTYQLNLQAGSGGNPPPNTIPVKFYTVGMNNERVSSYVKWDTFVGLTDAHGYALLYMVAGSHTFTFQGYDGTTRFDFTRSITVADGDVYTIYVITGNVVKGEPPPEPVNSGSGIWDWFLRISFIPGIPNWMLVAVAFVIVLALK